jgi:hypothetical protein
MLDYIRIARRAELGSESLLFNELGVYDGTTIADIRNTYGQSAGEVSDFVVFVGWDFVAAAQSAGTQ